MKYTLSRRRVLAGGGLGLTAALGGVRAFDGPESISDTDAPDWPMARYDAAGTGTNPDASGPKDEVQHKWEREPSTSVVGTFLISALVAPVHAAAIVAFLGAEAE